MAGKGTSESFSLQGTERDANKDEVFIHRVGSRTLYTVFDGVSSTKDARRVITLVISYIKKHFNRASSLPELFFDAHEYALDEGIGDGASTYVAVLHDEGKNEILLSHLGDSRIYSLEDDEFAQLTEDHNEKDNPHIITKALGFGQIDSDDFYEKPYKGGSRVFLLATDGFYEFLDDTNVLKLLREGQKKKELEKLIRGKNHDDATYLRIEL